MSTTNQTVLDFNKVQHGTFYYVNNYGHTKRLKPKHPTFLGSIIPDEFDECKAVDTWIPQISFQLTANHTIIYTGKKAVTMWKEWCRRIFKKGKS